jgi:hypothetical protein
MYDRAEVADPNNVYSKAEADAKYATKVEIAVGDWEDIPLSENWSIPSGFVAQYRNLQNGIVALRGRVKREVDATNTIGTLPEGVRPSYADIHAIPIFGAGTAFVEIKSDGTLVTGVALNSTIDIALIFAI